MTPLPIDIEAFQNAIHAWFEFATGLQTIWSDQDGPRPDYPYGTLKILSGPLPVSNSWEHRKDIDLDRPAGQEVRFDGTVQCAFTVSCQVFQRKNKQAVNESALAYTTRAQGSLILLETIETFTLNSIGVVRSESPKNLDALVEDAMMSRANLDVTFSAILSEKEYVGYIKKFELSGPDGYDKTISEEAPYVS